MARTRQNAKRSTGAIAPSKTLGTHNRAVSPSAHVHSNAVAQSIKATRKKRGSQTIRICKKGGQPSPPSEMPKKDKFCYLCQNGGHSLACNICPRVLCIDHLRNARTIPKRTLESLTFVCPSCHIHRARQRRKSDRLVKLPYTAFYVDDETTKPFLPQPVQLHVPYQVAQHARVKTNWLWIVHLRLSTLRGPGSVASMVHQGLRAYFVDDEEAYLVYHEIEFDLNTDADAEQHRKQIARILRPLADIPDARVMLFVYTHSHDTTGVPFFGAELAAHDVQNWFDVLIPEEVRPWLRKHDTTLCMLCCGAVVASETAYTQLKSHCEHLRVTRLLAFQAPAFQAALAAHFFVGYTLRFVIEGASFNEVQFGNVLAQSHNLGRHSRVIVMTPRRDTAGISVAEYFWTSPTIRPHGVDIPPQCPECYALSTFKITYDSRNRTTTTRCLEPGCTYTCKYEPPQESYKLLPTVEGSWAMRTRDL
ncbi:hypothetical protein OH77DRAFT_1588880 [Trametes cingulata]|nr:hypothetical protein OH77DRAFT_1588880 [Trametes cingulata]